MMTLAEIRDWLKTRVTCPQWYIGKFDGSKEQCICIYSLPAGAPVIAIGGLENTSYARKTISILIRWGNNANTAEQKAQEVYTAMFGQSGEIAEHRVISFDMRTAEPVSVGTDDEGIYEYVIETTIYYER